MREIMPQFPDRSKEVYTQPLGVMVNGKHTIITLALTEVAARQVRDEIKLTEGLWRQFCEMINSLREIDRLNSDAASAPMQTHELKQIHEILERQIPYGGALFVPFIDYVRQVGLDF